MINDLGGDFIITRLENAGYSAYYVGGCVRNHLLNQIVNDYDIATNANPSQVCDIFSDCKYFTTGIKHGTISIVLNNVVYEVTTFRANEKYNDFRHPSSLIFCNNIHDDLSRRDFTINALAYNKNQGIIDDFNGIYDLNNRILRCVNDPKTRFEEDALRILRGMRFSSTYTLTIEDETKNQMLNCSKYLSLIAKERILNELNGILLGDNVYSVLTNFEQILFIIFPAIAEAKKNNNINLEHYFKAITNSSKDFIVRLSLLFYPCKSYLTELLAALPFERKTVQCINQILSNLLIDCYLDDVKIKKLMSILKENSKRFFEVYAQIQLINNRNFDYISLFASYDRIIVNGECYSLTQLAIDGNDLKNMGFNGKQIKEKLNELLNLVIENKLANDKIALINHIKSYG